MPESLYGAHPKKLPVRFKLPSHLDLLRFQHAKVKVGSTDHELPPTFQNNSPLFFENREKVPSRATAGCVFEARHSEVTGYRLH